MRLGWVLLQVTQALIERGDRVPFSTRLIAPITLIFALVAFTIGARWLLAWDHGPDYGAPFGQRPLEWPLF